MAREERLILWSPTQRGVLIAFVLILSAALLVRLYLNRTYISDPQPPRPARFDELVDRIDPNVATWEELAVLPQIGEKRARDIVAYRESHGGKTAFASEADLTKVKGIGDATLATIRPHLVFPTTRPAYNPAR
jgi:competence ComEA-like helix-hairpin-helix protein